MANQTNRLEVVLQARTEQFTRAMRELTNEAKVVGAKISQHMEASGAGAESLTNAVTDAASSFGKLESEGSDALAKVGDEADQAGQEMAEAFARFEKALDTAELKTQKLRSSLSKVGDSSDVEQLKRKVSEVSDTLGEMEQATKKAGDGLAKAFNAQALGNFAGQIGEAAKKLGSFFEGAAEDARNIDRELKKAFSNPADVQKFGKIVGDIKAEFGDLANSDGLVQATKTLETFGIASEKELKRVINIAEATGKSYQEIAQRQGEFFAAAEGGAVNIDILERYRKTLGIGAKDLVAFGAQVDKNNKILGDTPEQIKAAQDALDKYLSTNERFNGVLERAQTGQDKLAAATGALNESIGVQVGEFKDWIAQGLVPSVEWLNTLSDRKKKLLGVSIAVGSEVAKVSSGMVQFAAYAKAAGIPIDKLSFSLKGAKAGFIQAAGAAKVFALSTAGMAAGLAIAAVGVFAIAKSFNDYQNAVISAEEAEQALIATQARAVIATKDRIASINKTVDALRAEYEAIEEYGARRSTIAKDIIQKESAAADARKKGNKKLADDLEADVRALRGVRSEFDLQAVEFEKAEAKKREAIAQSTKANEEAAAINKKLQEERTKKAKEEAEKRKQLEEQYAKEMLSLELNSIQQRTSIAKESPELATLQKRLEKGEEVVDLIKAETQEQNTKLQALLDEEATLGRIVIAREKAAAIKADPGGAKSIAEIAAEKERQLNTVTAQKKAALNRETAEALVRIEETAAKNREAAEKKKLDAAKKLQEEQKKQAAQEAALAELVRQRYELERSQMREVFEARERALDEEEARGSNVGQRRIDLERELQDFEKAGAKARLDQITKEINAKRDAANVGASPAEQQLNNERAKLAILQAQSDEKKTLQQLEDQNLKPAREHTLELQKQLDALKLQNDERKKASGFSIDTSFGASDSATEFGEGFGQMRKPKRTEDGKTEEDLEREIARSRIKETQVRESSATPSETTTRVNEASRTAQTWAEQQANPPSQQTSTPFDAMAGQASGQSALADPQIVALLQQIVAAINNSNQGIAKFGQQLTEMPPTYNYAAQWARGRGNTMI